MLATVRAARGEVPSCAGRSDRRPQAGLVRSAAVLVLGSLVGCTSMGPRDDLGVEVARYYAEHAIEEDGRCPSPEIATVTKRKVLASSGETTRLRVRYSYFDPSAPGATDWTRVLRAERPCTGFAERDFTLARGPLGYQVVEMSGPVREQP